MKIYKIDTKVTVKQRIRLFVFEYLTNPYLNPLLFPHRLSV